MSKAVQGLALLGGAVAMGVAAFLNPALIMSPTFDKIWAQLAIQGVAMEAGALAQALTSNRGMGITTRQPAANRQIILGNQRVGGVLIYESTTGSHHDQYNKVIVIAGHVCHSLLGLYLDGRKVHWDSTSFGYTVNNGVGFGGQADGNTYIGPDGNNYNFGGLVFAEARYGDQLSGDVLTSLTANDPNWAASAQGNPYVGGCTYIYLKVEYDTTMFPNEPEIRLDVNGKSDIFDPRTGTKGFTTNWALITADRMTDPKLGLGMDYSELNEPQLIAAANVCDELVPLAAGGNEARYAAHWHGDTSTGPADVIVNLMSAAAGRMSRIGGEWFLWPAYWQGPTSSFDKEVLTGDTLQWKPYRKLSERFNRVTGTYTAPNYPYNAAGNLYDSNGWYDGTIQNNFQYGYQPTNFPQFAMDPSHGYPIDEWLDADTGSQGQWAAGKTYFSGDIVWFNGSLYEVIAASTQAQPTETGDADVVSEDWELIAGNILPKEISMPCTLSVAQAQRVAKIYLMRNRYEGTGTMSCNLGVFGVQPTDVMEFTFPEYLGWDRKVLEISSFTFHVEERDSGQEGGSRTLACWIDLAINETGPDVYDWSVAEEQTVYAVPAGLQQMPYVVSPPTNLALGSTSSTGTNTGIGGNSSNWAIAVNYSAPLDVLVTEIVMQARPHTSGGTGTWYNGGTISVNSPQAYIFGVNQGSSYDVRIAGMRANGALSSWVEVDNYTV